MPRLRLLVRSALGVLALFAAPATLAQAPVFGVTGPAGDSLLTLDDDGGFVFRDPTAGATGAIPAEGAGARLMFWGGHTGAFRAGYVPGTEWDEPNVGAGSFAAGRATTASGNTATATGYQTTASGSYATATGYQTTASGGTATATGFQTTASGNTATATGYLTTASGDYSTALGYYASTNGHRGAFVIGDGSGTLLSATASNQFSAKFTGGYRLFTNGTGTVGVQLAAGANAWSTLSDSTRKERFRPYDPEAVLAGIAGLRLGTWNYRGQDPASQRHWGPMAQEFFAAFGRDGVGTVGSDTLIATADADGVLFAAVQALEARTRAQEARIAELEGRLGSRGGGAPLAAGLVTLAGLLGLGLVAARRR